MLQFLHSDVFGGKSYIHHKLGIQAPVLFKTSDVWRPRGIKTKGEHLLLVGVEGNFVDCFCISTWTAKLNGISPQTVMRQIEFGMEIAYLEKEHRIFGMPEYVPGSTAAIPLPPDGLYKNIVDIHWRPVVYDSLLPTQ
jgi:hypothetical protein